LDGTDFIGFWFGCIVSKSRPPSSHPATVHLLQPYEPLAVAAKPVRYGKTLESILLRLLTTLQHEMLEVAGLTTAAPDLLGAVSAKRAGEQRDLSVAADALRNLLARVVTTAVPYELLEVGSRDRRRILHDVVRDRDVEDAVWYWVLDVGMIGSMLIR